MTLMRSLTVLALSPQGPGLNGIHNGTSNTVMFSDAAVK
jgi:hypothetical protein